MDLTTLIGVLVGTFLIVQGIGLDKLGNFYDIKKYSNRGWRNAGRHRGKLPFIYFD